MTGIVILASILSYFKTFEAFISNYDQKVYFLTVMLIAILLGFGLAIIPLYIWNLYY